ncbi:MAG TPA: hypothetical protein PLG34_08715 [Spirochaetota bacterium]|nr:MAG: hypothetical protein BWX91_02221 [Spirochaetes bacterium ADurb.Bin133]HNZ26693.1 hypothetical protein [Spirochaetota bacterium]HPY88048.1 hypothetical protein [Spirochaetota bacterium]
MNLLIVTIGQRDVQYLDEQKRSYCPFDKFDLSVIQDKLKELKEANQIEWSSYKGYNETRKSIRIDEISDKIKVVFPMFEKIVEKTMELCGNKNELLDEIYIFYTDRTDLDKVDKDIKKSEPYYFHILIESFFKDLKKAYKNNNAVLNCKKIDTYKGEGSSGFSVDSIFKYFANFFNKEIDLKRYDSIYIGAKPGIPDVRLSIENLSLIYAREKVVIFDQDELSGKIIRSKNVENRLFYELKNVLELSLKNCDFSAAYNFISDSGYNQNYIKKNSSLYKLLEISYKWLYESSEEGIKYCNNFLICEKDKKNLNLVKKMKNMLNDSLINIVEKSIIRSIDQLYQGKYMMAMVLLNIAVENIPFIMLDMDFPDILVFKYKRKYIDLDKLPNFNIEIKKYLIEEHGYEKSLVYDNNTVLFKIFKEYEKRDNIKKANIFINDMRDFKEKRNYFLHTGNEPKKGDILKIFAFRNSEITIQKDDIDSIMIKKLLDICKYLTGYSYCNWISEMSNLCLKILKNIEIS